MINICVLYVKLKALKRKNNPLLNQNVVINEFINMRRGTDNVTFLFLPSYGS